MRAAGMLNSVGTERGRHLTRAGREEGPVGFSLMAIDRGVVSWRFKPLEAAWPVFLISSPADRRLLTVILQVR